MLATTSLAGIPVVSVSARQRRGHRRVARGAGGPRRAGARDGRAAPRRRAAGRSIASSAPAATGSWSPVRCAAARSAVARRCASSQVVAGFGSGRPRSTGRRSRRRQTQGAWRSTWPASSATRWHAAWRSSPGPAVQATTRLLVEVRPSIGSRPLADGATVRVHLATAETLARLRLVARTGSESSAASRRLGALILAEPIAAALDDRFVLRWPSPAETAGGGRVLDPAPPARLVRRRLDGRRLAALADARDPAERFGALVAAHRVLSRERADAVGGGPRRGGRRARRDGRASSCSAAASSIRPSSPPPRPAAIAAVAGAQADGSAGAGRPARRRPRGGHSHPPAIGARRVADGGRRRGHRRQARRARRARAPRRPRARSRPCARSTGVAAGGHGPPGGIARQRGAAVTG